MAEALSYDYLIVPKRAGTVCPGYPLNLPTSKRLANRGNR